MLALHLHRLARRLPRRYAIEHQSVPGGMDAIRHFLHLAVQAHTIPEARRRAIDANTSDYVHPATRYGPQLPDLTELPHERAAFHDLVATHDPAALLAYLDSLSERGVTAGGTPFDPQQLPATRWAAPLDRLLHPMLHLRNQLFDPTTQQAILHGFHPATMQAHMDAIRGMLHSPDLPYPQNTAQGTTPWQHLNQVLRNPQGFPGVAGHPLARALPNALERVGQGDTPTALADLVKMIHQLQGAGNGGQLFRAHETAHGLLHQQILPHLLQVGHQMTGGQQ